MIIFYEGERAVMSLDSSTIGDNGEFNNLKNVSNFEEAIDYLRPTEDAIAIKESLVDEYEKRLGYTL